jgi:hypothetical protein
MEPTRTKPAGVSRQPSSIDEHRHSVRHRVHSPAYASLDAASARATSDLSEIVDISEAGMSIQTTGPLEIDGKLNLTLDLSETKTCIRTPGQVIWSDASGRAGIRFLELTGQCLQQLKQWLFVNVLSAYDHARTYASSGDGDGYEATQHEFASASSGSASSDSGSSGSGSSGSGSSGSGSRSSGRGISPPGPVAVEREAKPGGQDRGTALQRIAEHALTGTGAGGAAIALSQGNEMVCMASAGSDAPPLGSRLQVGAGFSGECLRTGRTLRCDDSETDERVDRESCRALGLRAMVAVPVRRGNKVVGLLEVFSSRQYAFNAEDTALLQSLAGDISSVLGQGADPRTLTAPVMKPEAGAATIAPARIEERQPAEALAGTVAAGRPSPHKRVYQLLMVAAGLTLLFALTWLIAPWASSRMRQSEATAVRPQPPQVVAPKQPDLSEDVNDLASLRKVAERGDPAAQFALGARYATGEEVQQDYTEAVRWFTQAAERGHILAQATLGAYYWAGRGVTPDLTKAYFWSVLAQAGGDQASKYRVAVLTSRMTRSQILAAQEQANDWLRRHQLPGNAAPRE